MHTYTCFKFRRPRINAKRALPDNTSGSGLLSTMLLAKERKPSLPPWDGSWRGDFVNAAVLCLVAQLYLTLCNSMDYSSPGPSVHGILQQEYWSGLPGSPPGDLPKPGIEPRSPALQADSLPSEPPGKPIQLMKWPHYHLQAHGSMCLVVTFYYNYLSSRSFSLFIRETQDTFFSRLLCSSYARISARGHFSGTPVVKTLSSQYRGLGFNPWSVN